MTVKDYHEQQFFDALNDIFIGAKIEGESGYINLMHIKSRYYREGVFPQLKKDIDEAVKDFPDFREELFDKLYSFFQRYFSESGSIYFRYTPLHQNIYEKVYTDDRDVVLFWKTHMLYYVKTDRLFKSLAVEVDDVKFWFDASALELKRANEKREVIFSYREKRADGTLVFEVGYSERGRITKQEDILKALKKEGVELSEETLNKAFRVFEKQSEVDFFINKDARAFLREQFDLWMYQYLFEGQNVWSEQRLAQLQALKSIAYKVIDFISQFEDELVKIWNKPKFVRNSHYVLTIDRIIANSATPVIATPTTANTANSATLFSANPTTPVIASPDTPVIASPAGAKQSSAEREEIASGTERPRNDIFARLLAHPNMPQQVQEWCDLGMVDEDFRLEMLTQKDLTGAPLHPQYQHLPIDTKYFSDLELDILALFDDLDSALDGWLIKSENYQALNTILPKFKGMVQTIYIDPPFNLDSSDQFMYRTNYKDANWATLLENRLRIAKDWLNEKGSIFVRCDYNGNWIIRPLLDVLFNHNIQNEIILNRFKKESGVLTTTTESLFLYSKTQNIKFNKLKKLRECIYCKQEIKPEWQWSHSAGESNIPKYFTVDGKSMLLYPPKGRHWTNSQETIYKLEAEGRIRINKNISYIDSHGNRIAFIPEKLQESETYVDSNWTDIPGYEFGVFSEEKFSTQNSEELLERVILSASDNKDIVFDFFLGSGTTTAVAHKLGRKWLGVEMGEHFYTVVLPRMKKVFAYDKSGISKEIKDYHGGGFFKYFELEQYEDVLRRTHYEDSDLFHDPSQDPYHSYVFRPDLKMLDSLEADAETNTVHFHPERLYPDIDLAETLSHLRGKWIKRITAEYVEFEDGEQMSLTDPDWQTLKPMIWWQ